MVIVLVKTQPTYLDSVAQLVEHYTFNVGVLESYSSRVTIKSGLIMKRVFLVLLDRTGVAGEHHIIGFISSNNRNVIANYIKERYDLMLQDLLPNRFSFQDGVHWEYLTDRPGVNVHVDVCYNLE